MESTAPRARHAVRDLLVRRGVPLRGELMDTVLLIVTELAANAARHAALLSPEIGIEVSAGAGWVEVAVEDGHPYQPAALPAGPHDTGGRGLLLVTALTREAGGRWAVDRTANGGKTVSVRLPLGGGGGGGEGRRAPGG
ncbi:ATP-binding protein [Streptomyces sp. F63]|uniref:ATP-binding protein n=1 Tax=Streptomyces sp. F63 TaxID=2824887 RepID=UPI0027DAF237|nr:ATP-binding protein [Streptomyces sp. F63]